MLHLSNERNVTDEAVCGQVWIHFFINYPQYALTDGIYQRIANQTHGTLLRSFSDWDITNFAATYHTKGCKFLEGKHPLPISQCKVLLCPG